jgi:hypothetical protein
MAAFILALVVLVLAVTALTLAATSAIQAAQVAMFTCALLACLPLVLFGAFKLGEVLGERKCAQADDAMRVSAPPIGQTLERGDAMKALPSPELPTLSNGVSAIRPARATRRVRPRVRGAMRIAQRWFR